MSDIDPPYRLDPLQNIVDVKWSPEESDALHVRPGGLVTVGAVASWFLVGQFDFTFPSSGSFGGLIPYPPLKLKGSGTGNFSGGSGTGGPFALSEPNYFPVGTASIAGSFNVIDGGGQNAGGPFLYDFTTLIFTERDGLKRVFHVTGAVGGGVYDFDLGGIPRSVALHWGLIFTL